MVLYDLGTSWSDCYASANKDVEEAVWAMSQFAGSFPISSFYSDCAGELIRSAKRQGWMHYTAVPHHSKTNGRVEREIRHIEEGTRTLLMRAGLDPHWWPLAVRAFCFGQNIRCRGQCKNAWEQRFGKPFQGLRLPFGAGCHFLPCKPRAKTLGKFDTPAQPGVFLGWHLKPGGKHSKRYLVAMLDDFRVLIAAGKPAWVLVQEVKEVTPLPQEHFYFPLYSQYQCSKWSLHGGRPESRPEIEVEVEPDVPDEDPIVKRPLEPVPSGEPQDSPAGSSSDPSPGTTCPEDPFPHVVYPIKWFGVTWFQGPWELQRDGSWV